jgi:hypothetical protein
MRSDSRPFGNYQQDDLAFTTLRSAEPSPRKSGIDLDHCSAKNELALF